LVATLFVAGHNLSVVAQ